MLTIIFNIFFLCPENASLANRALVYLGRNNFFFVQEISLKIPRRFIKLDADPIPLVDILRISTEDPGIFYRLIMGSLCVVRSVGLSVGPSVCR